MTLNSLFQPEAFYFSMTGLALCGTGILGASACAAGELPDENLETQMSRGTKIKPMSRMKFISWYILAVQCTSQRKKSIY